MDPNARERILGFAQKAFIVRNGRLLVIRRSAGDPINPYRWEVPGGRMKPGELIDDHIRREVFEEVGLEIVAGVPFHIWQWSVPLRQKNAIMEVVGVARLCRCDVGEPSIEHQEQDDYIDKVEWTDIRSLSDYDLIPNMRPVAAAFQAFVAGGVHE